LTAPPNITTRKLRLEESGSLSAVSLWQEFLNVAKISLFFPCITLHSPAFIPAF